MSRLITVITALLCSSTVAIECTGGSCADQDEPTSLLQAKSVLKPGSDRDEGVPEEHAIVDSMPYSDNAVKIMEAYSRNSDEAEEPIEEIAAHHIGFDRTVRNERAEDYKDAVDRIAETKHEVADQLHLDHEDVVRTAEEHAKVVHQAEEIVANAKANAEAHAIEAKQVEHAAIVGRIHGHRKGEDNAARMVHAYEHELAHEAHEAKVRAAHKAAMERRIHHEMAINKGTEKKHHQEDAWVDHVKHAGTRMEEHAMAKSHWERNAIEGPGGFKNHMIEQAADDHVEAYDRAADADQGDIEKTAAGLVQVEEEEEDLEEMSGSKRTGKGTRRRYR
jgi:hypothetical protein